MSEKWLVIGISGVTCGGKTTLATELKKNLKNVTMFSQDDYFWDVNDSRHVWIPELNHINFDVLSSLDMKKMHTDITTVLCNRNKCFCTPKHEINCNQLTMKSKTELVKILNTRIDESNLHILLVEGFCIFNYKPVQYLCDVKYYFTLNKSECCKRRSTRIYDPPDCPGYFEKCVWPEHILQLEDVRKNVKDVKWFNEFSEDPFKEVLLDLYRFI